MPGKILQVPLVKISVQDPCAKAICFKRGGRLPSKMEDEGTFVL